MIASPPSILITGAEGFVGSYLIRELLPLKVPIYATYLAPRPGLGEMLPDDRLVQCDLTNRQRVFNIIKEIQPTCIYHLAGISFVPLAESKRQLALDVNLGGTLNLLEALAETHQYPRLILISSGEVYGKVPEARGALREEFPLRPTNFYAATKAAAEKIAWSFFERGDLTLTIFRPFNHIGPGQAPSFVVSDFARQVARITLGMADPRVYVGDIDVFRDFTDVRDIARGYRMCYESFTPGGIYNLASGCVVSIREILNTLISFSPTPIEIVQDPARFRKSEIKRVAVSIENFQAATGWAPQIPLEQTLREVYNAWINTLTKESV